MMDLENIKGVQEEPVKDHVVRFTGGAGKYMYVTDIDGVFTEKKSEATKMVRADAVAKMIRLHGRSQHTGSKHWGTAEIDKL